jgi:hypothetical protein
MHFVVFLDQSNDAIMVANALCFAYTSLILFLFKKQPVISWLVKQHIIGNERILLQ